MTPRGLRQEPSLCLASPVIDNIPMVMDSSTFSIVILRCEQLSFAWGYLKGVKGSLMDYWPSGQNGFG